MTSYTTQPPYHNYHFVYDQQKLQHEQATNQFWLTIGGKQKLCFVGASHARHAASHLTRHFPSMSDAVEHVMAKWPKELREAGENAKELNCTTAVIGIGQWPAGWPEEHPMDFTEYRDAMRDGLVQFTEAVSGKTRVVVRSVHENPLGNAISACPPKDWRNPEVIRIYNRILFEVCEDLSIRFIDTTAIISPLYDTAEDWCHYNNSVGLSEALHFARILEPDAFFNRTGTDKSLSVEQTHLVRMPLQPTSTITAIQIALFLASLVGLMLWTKFAQDAVLSRLFFS